MMHCMSQTGVIAVFCFFKWGSRLGSWNDFLNRQWWENSFAQSLCCNVWNAGHLGVDYIYKGPAEGSFLGHWERNRAGGKSRPPYEFYQRPNVSEVEPDWNPRTPALSSLDCMLAVWPYLDKSRNLPDFCNFLTRKWAIFASGSDEWTVLKVAWKLHRDPGSMIHGRASPLCLSRHLLCVLGPPS